MPRYIDFDISIPAHERETAPNSTRHNNATNTITAAVRLLDHLIDIVVRLNSP